MQITRKITATVELPVSAESLAGTLNQLGLSEEEATKPLGVRVLGGKLTITFPAPPKVERKPRKKKEAAAA